MRRTIFLALLAALLFAPPARADWIEILRDCNDDSVLQGTYTAAELRDARKHLPTDVDEYGDCRDVLADALAAKTSTANSGGGGGNGDTTGSTSSTGGGGTGSSGGDPTLGGTPETTAPPLATGPDSGTELPHTPQETAAIVQAAEQGNREMLINGRPVSPGAATLAAGVGRNGLPASLIVLLLLLCGAGIAAAAPTIRRRVIAHRQS